MFLRAPARSWHLVVCRKPVTHAPLPLPLFFFFQLLLSSQVKSRCGYGCIPCAHAGGNFSATVAAAPALVPQQAGVESRSALSLLPWP